MRDLRLAFTSEVGSLSPFAWPASQGWPLARPPLAIPRGTQLRGPAGSLRCSSCRGRSQTRYAQTPRASFSRQLCATRPSRWGWVRGVLN